MDWLFDRRTDCFSVQTSIEIGEYLDMVKSAHSARGALTGQRDTLRTTTAKRIRDRLVSDIRRGAVIPPVVIGAVVNDRTFGGYPNLKAKSPGDFLPTSSIENLSIIDGMQRTAAFSEAVAQDVSVKKHMMRVEFWITKSVRTMVYRMLVLNTGQVPWTLARQLSVVFSPLLAELEQRVPEIERIMTPDKPGRRVAGGEFSSDALVELYIAFSVRKTNVDTKEALSDEFSRLDFVESLSDTGFQEYFYDAVGVMSKLDITFSRYEGSGGGRFSKGRNIFDGQPARIGFIVAVAQHVLGRPGMDRDVSQKSLRMKQIVKSSTEFVSRLGKMNAKELGSFLKLDVLAETLDRRVGQVGRYERGVFFDAFQVLIEEKFKLESLEPCWRAN